MSANRYLCIHGHFYQPPRENPWLEAIEQQDSAAPYHDWNERVTAECYTPNSAARTLDSAGHIVKIVNNYAGISFNFGPTLLSWMEQKSPETYRAILDADRASAQRFSGHGSAMAQCYNHMIMPLANSRDKLTQVRWGIADFRHRFGREPEGMWLPETAVDLESLDLLAQHGIRFTVLAPSQANWVDGVDVSGQRIDPSRAYRQELPSGREISLFFYDGPVSRAIAFEHVLDNGERFAERLLDALSDQRTWPQLAHVATDGETYGHHHSFGDMALAFALDRIEAGGLAKVTNYGEYLENHPAEHEVEILENTAWSCVHGVGRWNSNCGCNSGGHAGWNQKWRAPLRRALDWLRDEVAKRYEKDAARHLKDPWEARNAYIGVVLDHSPESRARFLADHFRRKNPRHTDQVRVWKLLEMQRHAMLMYTSCGWFFDELTGIETVQVIQYAGRVVELAQEVFGEPLEAQFLERLALAKSNLPEHRDGAAIYAKFVKPAMLDLPKLGAHYAIRSLFADDPGTTRFYSCSVETIDYRVKRSAEKRLAFGKIRLTSEVTRESELLFFGALHLGGHNLRAAIGKFQGADAYRRLLQPAREAFAQGQWDETARRVEQAGQTYSLKNLLHDERRWILQAIVAAQLDQSVAACCHAYEAQALLLAFLAECGIPIPGEMKATAEVALNHLLERALSSGELDQERIQGLLEQTRVAGVTLDERRLEAVLRRNVEAASGRFSKDPRNPANLDALRRTVASASAVPLKLVLWRVQNQCYEVLEEVYPALREEGQEEWLAGFRELAGLLSLRVV
ncbi:MAG TPA: DUF3536 domain-containing protein [Bryobacteraceae bacterium]|nr:DUF3536 domain-containing protein [Bryobacteraceae bacterium]